MMGVTGGGRVLFARFSGLGSIWSQEARVMYVILLIARDAANCGRLRQNALVLFPKMDVERPDLSGPA